MRAGIHKEMAHRIVSDCPKASTLEFLKEGVAKPEWKKNEATKNKWLKEWMDMPDSNTHTSKLKNDHSYKLTKTDGRFRIVFAKSGNDQATVVARLKYAARSIKEWKIEEEYRACALELAKSIHWVIDMSSPSHVVFGWDDTQHSRVETDFDKVWKKYYDKTQVKFGRKTEIKDIYRWAKKKIEDSYDRNMKLLQIYNDAGSILKGDGESLGREIIKELAQNLADYLAYIDRLIDFDKVAKKVA